MPIIDRIRELQGEMTAWRRDIHAHPETAFEEHRTVAGRRRACSPRSVVEVHRGLAKTGVVGSCAPAAAAARSACAPISTRCTFREQNTFAHRSNYDGKMHACGHDGHTTMLLGAAKYLAATRNFDGTVHFIFQPAEENEGGGRVMVEEGLFEKFPCEAVYGMHNWPGLPVGQFGAMPGPVMASFDIFEIVITGRGAHGAMPHDRHRSGRRGRGAGAGAADDPEPQRESGRRGRGQRDAVPCRRHLERDSRGRRRCAARRALSDPRCRIAIEAGIRRIVAGIDAAYGTSSTVRYERRYPPTINAERETGDRRARRSPRWSEPRERC